ncbi:MAG: hypothetical protein J7L15_05380 [Clostridiales bacterium]|nr:hypothetical protein [Clostridiales bacterium]
MGYIYVDDLPQTEEADRPVVQLTGTDGNVFNLLAECKKAMKRYHNEIDDRYNVELMFQEMWDEVQQGDYDNALQIMMSYCEVH